MTRRQGETIRFVPSGRGSLGAYQTATIEQLLNGGPASPPRADLQPRLPRRDVRLPPRDTAATNSQRSWEVPSLHLAVDRCDVQRRHVLDFPLVEKLRFVRGDSALGSGSGAGVLRFRAPRTDRRI